MPRRRSRRDYLIPVEDDGLITHPVGPWADEKYRRFGMYAQMFSTGMKRKWNCRVYLDLYSGPGYCRIRGTGRTVLGSPLIALELPDPFDRYVFCDVEPKAIDALKVRVERVAPRADVQYIVADANDVVDQVRSAIPAPRAGFSVLSLCFLDPFKLNIHFDTIMRLADGRAMDFLVLMALYVDANRNVAHYIRDESPRIDRFLGNPDWRDHWARAERESEPFVRFLALEFSRAMESIGYLRIGIDRMVKIRSNDKRLPLYYLASFSKHERGLQFWDEVLKYSADQLPLDL